ncbi:Protein CAP22 [Fusarium austroafricanum]|uniref:Protein CAP22 n=1 Tax=Fusarium austroafricanum TaxID=2364996 RepID=A0A8H4NPI4_9HYPO|nr:Protein CAP22 [Fusarium austroafricanum]
MYTSTIALALAPLVLLARADMSLDRDDVPRACDAICAPIVQLTKQCDTDLRGDRDREEDRLEAQCVCTNNSFNVSRIAALCADCVRQNVRRDDDDDDDNDRNDDTEEIDDIMRTCGFSSTTYVASAASSAVSGVTVDATRPTDASQLTTTITGGARTNEPSPTGTGTRGGNGGSDASATNNASSPDETNAAAAMAPYGVIGAVVGAAMLLA